MNNPVILFRKSFLYSLIIVIPFLSLSIADYFYSLATNSRFDTFLWLQETLSTISQVSLFTLTIPWLLMLFFSELFYTRSLNKQNVFKLIWNEYLKWFIPLSIISLIIIYVFKSYNYSSIYIPRYKPVIAIMCLNLFLVFVMASNSKIIKATLSFSIPVFLITAYLGNYQYNDIEVGKYSSLVLWIIFLIYCYFKVSNFNSDIDLNVPGRADDENRAMSNMWIFSKEFGNKEILLTNIKSGFQKFLAHFKLLTSQSGNLYKQVLLILSGIIFYFALGNTIRTIDNSINKIDYSFSSLLILLTGIGVIIFCLVNSKYFILPIEEFLLTRSVSRKKIYLYNFILQGIFISIISLLGYLIAYFTLPTDFFNEINFLTIFFTIFWLALSGEIGILALIILFYLDFSQITFYNSLTWTNIFTAFFQNLHTIGLSGVLIWIGALFFRFWDLKFFDNKDIGLFKGIRTTLNNFGNMYLIPIIFLLIISISSIYLNPITRFINETQNHQSTDVFLVRNIYYSVFFKSPSFDESFYNVDPSNPNYDFYQSEIAYNSKIRSLFKDLRKNSQNENLYTSFGNTIGDRIKNDIETLYYQPYYNKDYFNSPKYFYYNDREYYIREKITYLLNLASNKKNSNEYLYLESLSSFFNDNYNKAIDNMENIVKNSETPKYYEFLAILYNHELQPLKEISIYNKLIEINPNKKGDYLSKVGDTYWNNGFYETGLDFYVKSVLADHTKRIPLRGYYSKGLCSNLKSYYNKYSHVNFNLKNDINVSLAFCDDTEIPKYINTGKAFNREVNFIEYKNDKFKSYLEKNDLESIKKSFNKQGTNVFFKINSTSYSFDKLGGLLALFYMEKNQSDEEIKNIIEISEKKEKSLKNDYPILRDLNYSIYDENLYLAKFRFEDNKFENAKKLLLISSKPEKYWNEITNEFISYPDKLKELEDLKKQYNKLYEYMENNGYRYISNIRTIEKTRVILNKIDNNNLPFNIDKLKAQLRYL